MVHPPICIGLPIRLAFLLACALLAGVAQPSYGTSDPLPEPSLKAPIVIAMVGDSITYGGKWTELLGREDISNHGVIGESTGQFVRRLEDVYREQPRICFVMGGVNDIAGGVPVEVVFSNLRSIVQGLRKHQIIPVVTSTLYTRIPRYNRRIERLNTMLAAYARKYRVDFIDLNSALSRNRLLERKFTFDGIHLRPNAYEKWRVEVERTLTRHEIGPGPMPSTRSDVGSPLQARQPSSSGS